MSPKGEHIPYPRIAAALRAEQLSWLIAHRDSLGLADDAEVCRMLSEQRPEQRDQLNLAALDWIRRYALEARGQRREDYVLIVQAFDRLPAYPERSAGELRALCAARGLAGY